MAEKQQFHLRVMYSKSGRLVMLSHLEVAEALRRAVRRADLPFAVSQGFSPHMKLVFSSALPVGVGSVSEIVDITLNEYLPPKEALERLQWGSVPDLMVTSCKYIEKKEKAASVAYPIGCYHATFDGDPSNLAFPDQITVVRAGKKPKTQVVADYLRMGPDVNGNSLTFALEALNTGSLRPDNLLRATLEEYNSQAAVPLNLISCTRVDQRDGFGNSLVQSMNEEKQ